MESSLEEAPKEKVHRVEIWGSWGPFMAPDHVSTHSSLIFSVEKLEDLSFNVTESGVERVTYFGSIPVFSIVGKKRQTKGTNSESKQNSGILRYGSSVERGSLNSSSGGTTMAVSYFKASFSKTAP